MSSNRNTTNVPERLITKADLTIGDVLVFRPLSDLKALEQAKCLVYGWDDRMASLLNKEYVVTQEMLNYSGERIDRIEIDGWIYTVGISMLRLKNAEDTTEGTDDMIDENKFSANIKTAKTSHDAAIITEMKSLVDKKRIKLLLSILASQSGSVYMVDNEKVDGILTDWAHAKYDMYLMFGKKLSLQTSVEVAVNDSDIKAKVQDVCSQFPVYGMILEQFEASEYRENSIKYSHSAVQKHAGDLYKTGMKLSKFLSSFIKVPDLDVAVSKIMQDKTATHDVYVSIDPYDYLTMSLNQHDWDSCHRITDGCYGTGAISYMLDEDTMIAYRSNGKEYDYNCFNLKFKGNSKSWRQCVYFDKTTCAIIFGRQYPNNIEDISKAIRIHLEDTVSAYVNAPRNLWRVMSNTMDAVYDDNTDLHYSDVENGYNYKFVKLRDVEYQSVFSVGHHASCLMCGSSSVEHGSTCVCKECRDENDYEED